MNLGKQWQAHWLGPSLSLWWWRGWWETSVWPWVLQNFRWGKWPSKGFRVIFRYWRFGLVEFRRMELPLEEAHERAARGEL